MRDKKSYLFAVLVVIGTALYLWGQHELTRRQQLASVTVTPGLPTEVVENQRYQAGRPAEVTMSENASLFRKGETYAFYSALNIQVPGRYFLHRGIKKGEVLFVAGLPLISNSLIGLRS